jgi:predicted metal-binding membrane protein
MAAQLQISNPAGGDEATLPVGFIAICLLAFAVGVWATVYFCRSMCCELEMPGGWTMSMMWMRMRGQSWVASAASFLFMWLAMMVAMMLPSAVPTFLHTKRANQALSVMAAGYFAVWLAAGAVIYLLGVAFSAAVMHWESFSRIVPVLSGAALILAGGLQLTRWKTSRLLRCRSSFGCFTGCPSDDSDFRLGCKQGAACCACCAAPMTIQLVLGIMNPLVMIIVAAVIAAEKLLPRPTIVARLVGISTIIAGIAYEILLLCKA